jgi:hypothetical protein
MLLSNQTSEYIIIVPFRQNMGRARVCVGSHLDLCSAEMHVDYIAPAKVPPVCGLQLVGTVKSQNVERIKRGGCAQARRSNMGVMCAQTRKGW